MHVGRIFCDTAKALDISWTKLHFYGIQPDPIKEMENKIFKNNLLNTLRMFSQTGKQ